MFLAVAHEARGDRVVAQLYERFPRRRRRERRLSRATLLLRLGLRGLDPLPPRFKVRVFLVAEELRLGLPRDDARLRERLPREVVPADRARPTRARRGGGGGGEGRRRRRRESRGRAAKQHRARSSVERAAVIGSNLAISSRR